MREILERRSGGRERDCPQSDDSSSPFRRSLNQMSGCLSPFHVVNLEQEGGGLCAKWVLKIAKDSDLDKGISFFNPCSDRLPGHVPLDRCLRVTFLSNFHLLPRLIALFGCQLTLLLSSVCGIAPHPLFPFQSLPYPSYAQNSPSLHCK